MTERRLSRSRYQRNEPKIIETTQEVRIDIDTLEILRWGAHMAYVGLVQSLHADLSGRVTTLSDVLRNPSQRSPAFVVNRGGP